MERGTTKEELPEQDIGGGICFPNQTCHKGFLCDNDVCVAEPGKSEGCGCDASASSSGVGIRFGLQLQSGL